MEELKNLLNYLLIFACSYSLIDLILGKKKLPVYPFFIILYLIIGNLNIISKEVLNINYKFVYEFLLPIILFESAINLNIHRFKIQLKTLTFLTTVSLLINALITSFFIKIFFNISFVYSLIFGVLISATDPIGVLAFVKEIKIPERLKQIIEGESLLNDATTIIFFELVILLTFINNENNNIFINFINLFSFKIFLSIFFGIIFGFFLNIISKIFQKDLHISNVLIFPLIIVSYILAEHFHLSGPIFIIFSGIIFSNFSFAYFQEKEFEKEKYFFSIIVLLINIYFFATTSINIELNLIKNLPNIINFLKINLIILIARSISIYINFLITNKHKLFSDEPDIYPSWQHIINFAGLRGVIPLILVNQLPNYFIYKDLFYNFTIYVFIFTNLINPFIVIFLIKKFEKLFYSKIYITKNTINKLIILIRKNFHLEEDKKIIKNFSTKKEISDLINSESIKNINEIKNIFKKINKLEEKELIKSFHLLGAQIEKESHLKSYKEQKIDYYDLITLISELDLQVDALLYPEKFANRVVDEKGFIISKKSWRLTFIDFIKKINLKLINKNKKYLIEQKKQLYFERIISSVRVINTLKIISNFKETPKKIINAIKRVENDHLFFIKYNFEKILSLDKEF
jgi:CPA1 family monovalent cation:H+ antiporter